MPSTATATGSVSELDRSRAQTSKDDIHRSFFFASTEARKFVYKQAIVIFTASINLVNRHEMREKETFKFWILTIPLKQHVPSTGRFVLFTIHFLLFSLSLAIK